MQTKKTEIWVGVFLLVALLAALFVCLKAANVTSLRTEPTYRLYATFDNIGGLKARSPVRIGGVVVGRVADITLDPKTYLPRVGSISMSATTISRIPVRWRSAPLACWASSTALNVGFEDPTSGRLSLKTEALSRHQVRHGAGRSDWSVPL